MSVSTECSAARPLRIVGVWVIRALTAFVVHRRAILKDLPPRLQRLLHPRDDFETDGTDEAVSRAHSRYDPQRALNQRSRAAREERPLDHILGAAFAPCCDHNRDRDQVLEPVRRPVARLVLVPDLLRWLHLTILSRTAPAPAVS